MKHKPKIGEPKLGSNEWHAKALWNMIRVVEWESLQPWFRNVIRHVVTGIRGMGDGRLD